MAEPKKRMTSTRSGNRQSHDALKARLLSVCPQCKSTKPGHQVCASCGYYKGKKVLNLKEDTKKAQKAEEELKDE
jgi:large subunit ribosomal protein L32